MRRLPADYLLMRELRFVEAVKYHFRRYIRDSEFFFRVRLKLRKRPLNVIFPDPGVDLFITGFPRSGNSFTLEWLQRAAPQLRIASHMHSIGSIKAALSARIPIVMLIRRPEDAVASLIAKEGIDPSIWQARISLELREYIRYYTFIARQETPVLMIEFNMATKQPWRVARLIETMFESSFEMSMSSVYRAQEEALAHIREDRRNPFSFSRHFSKQGFQNERKEALKQSIAKVIRRSPELATANAIYLKLLYARVANVPEDIFMD